MSIKWNKVTKLSQLVAVVLFVGIFCWGVFVGRKVGVHAALGAPVSDAWFKCADNKSIHTVFYKHAAHVALSHGPELFLPQTSSASGARYATDDDSLVFWNKGDAAFVTENSPANITYQDCREQ